VERQKLTTNGIYIVTAGFLTGVFVASFGLPIYSVVGFLLTCAVLIGVYTFYFVHPAREHVLRSHLFFVTIFLICASLGFVRFALATPHIDQDLLTQVGKSADVAGTIIEKPQEKGTYRLYVIQTDSKTKILVRGSMFPVYSYGDSVSVYGGLDLPKPFATDSGRTFDYQSYLYRDGITFVMSHATLTKVGEGNVFFVSKILFNLRDSLVASFERVMPYPESGLLSGIVLGDADGMSNSLTDTFRKVGIIHIIVLSGYNIMIVAESARRLFSRFGRNYSLALGALAVILFSIMSGGGASVVRAAIMALLAISAQALRRKYDVGRGLTIAALVMVVINPWILVYDLGFQLSFLATVALIWFSPFLTPHLGWITEKWGLREIASATISAQIFVMPLLIYSSGIVSLSGFFVNLIVLPIVPMLMGIGFFTGILGFFGYWVAFVPAMITYFMLFYIIWIAEHVSQIPGSYLSLSAVSPLIPVVCYAIFTAGFFYMKNKKSLSVTKQAPS
jgi:competence protein ComEC